MSARRWIDWTGRIIAIVAIGVAVASLSTVRAVPLSAQPQPDAGEYADTAHHLANGDGYVTTFRHLPGSPPGPSAPAYEPGYPVLLAPFAAVGRFPADVQVGARLWAVVYVLVMAGSAWALGGPWAGAIVALIVYFSPFARTSASLVMAEAAVAAFAVAVLPLVRKERAWAAALAGLLAGIGATIRVSEIFVLLGVLIVLRGRRRLLAAVSSAPPLFALAIYQWAADGAPWRTGYNLWYPSLKPFSLSYVNLTAPISDGIGSFPDRLHGTWATWACPGCNAVGPNAALPHVIFYPLVLAGFFWIVTPPLVGLGALVLTLFDRHQSAARLSLLVTAMLLVFNCLYYYQAARFMVPAISMLVVTGAASLTHRLGLFSTPPSFPPTRLSTWGIPAVTGVIVVSVAGLGLTSQGSVPSPACAQWGARVFQVVGFHLQPDAAGRAVRSYEATDPPPQHCSYDIGLGSGRTEG